MNRLWVRVAVSLLATAAAVQPLDRAQGTGPADAVRFQMVVSSWGMFTRAADIRCDTLFVTARPGETIGATELGRFGSHFRARAPIAFGRAESADRVRVRFFSHDLVPRLLWQTEPWRADSGSVLVSTTMRTFTTTTTCGGTTVELRIARVMPGPEVRSRHTLEVIPRQRYVTGRDQLDYELKAAHVVGLFRVLRALFTGDSIHYPARQQPVSGLEYQAEEIWKGIGVWEGQRVRVVQNSGAVRAGCWFPAPSRTPICPGESQILFLRAIRDTWPQAWTFSPYDGYAKFDDTGTLVSSVFGRRVPSEQFRRNLIHRLWSLSHVEKARTHGRVLHAASWAPGRGLRVSVGGASVSAFTDSTGYFELFDVPIGFNELRVEGPRVHATAIVEFSDEFTDSLEVRVPF